ncbi:probable E3 ubiquitin-protein ligase bre1 [Heterodontus francisci]|uniref:probable E3 ubiquitin-protein ligase bre1 n=1 Tax=Heterodontus francisci TaxID=7792 RepID=UPI00355B21C8
MAKMKNGNETTVKVEKNTKGRRTQKLLINTEEMWSDDVLIDSRQLPKWTSHKKRGRFETNNSICSNPKGLSRAISVDNFEVSQCGKNEDFEEAENTCSQNPPCPMKVSIVKKERKHLTNKSETLQINEKIFAKPRLIIATMKPFGLRIVRSNSAPTVNVSIQHIQKWKMKMRTQSKQQSEDILRKRISVPIDSHLENSNNNVVKAWIHQKNMLLRKERKAKRKQRRLERAEHKRQEIDHQKRQRESEEKVKTWMEKKNINRIQKNMKVNNCMISLGTGANTQNAKTSPPVVNGVRKSVNQSSAKTLKTEKQITEDNLEMNKKRVLILGTEKSKTEIMSSRPSKDLSKDQVTSSCKMEATLVQDSQHGSQESQKSNSKKVQKIKLVHQEIKQKAFSKSTSFRKTKRDTPSSGNTPQIKGLDNGNCRRGTHLIHRLPFNEWLSRKSKESKEIRAKMKEQETELDKDFQNIVPKLASKRIQNKMDSKKRVNTGKEFDRLANISLVSEFTGVTQNPKWLQEAIVTPAVKNWFVHRMEENLHDVSGNSSIQDDQKVQLKTSYSLYGKPYKAAEERSKALKQGHILRDKEVGETLSDLNAKLC